MQLSLILHNPVWIPPDGQIDLAYGAGVPGGRYLHLYAANLGRGADGNWRVIGDRTQAPSGAGYALDDRFAKAE